MALIKNKILDDGTEVNYWVAEPKTNMVSKKTDVLMLGYKDKAIRDAGKQFMVRERVPSIEGIYLTGEQVYAGVKASRMSEATEETEATEQNWFADAIDDLE